MRHTGVRGRVPSTSRSVCPLRLCVKYRRQLCGDRTDRMRMTRIERDGPDQSNSIRGYPPDPCHPCSISRLHCKNGNLSQIAADKELIFAHVYQMSRVIPVSSVFYPSSICVNLWRKRLFAMGSFPTTRNPQTYTLLCYTGDDRIDIHQTPYRGFKPHSGRVGNRLPPPERCEGKELLCYKHQNR